MRYLSVCSGIEAASVAWHPLGWEPVGFCEIEAFPSAVLKERYPHVVNYGDFTRLTEPDHPIRSAGIDLLVGGTPCQAFSVAGLRRGLADPRGGLTLEFVRLAQCLRPRWIVWENVPGVLSQDGGRAFGAFLGALGELGYGWAYRVLDAQYVRVDGYPHAVPQRRRRVFVVGCAGGDFARSAAVLLEPEGVRRDPPTRRTTRQDAAVDAAGGFEVCGTLSDGAHHGGGLNGQDAYTGRILPVASTYAKKHKPMSDEDAGGNGIVALGFEPRYYTRDNKTGGHPACTVALTASAAKAGDAAPTVVAYVKTHKPMSNEDAEGWSPQDHSPTITYWPRDRSDAGTDVAVVQTMSVRRLTPTECERLQGFPDGWTQIAWKGKPASECPDGPRYRALGNSMAVNVMRWIGRRIELVEKT